MEAIYLAAYVGDGAALLKYIMKQLEHPDE
jgi:hypothetical protein